MDSFDPGNYTQEELDALDTWEVVETGPPHKRTKRVASGSKPAYELLHDPLRVLIDEDVPYVTEQSTIKSTIDHHERGLKSRIIKADVTTYESGEVTIAFEKEL